MRQPERALRPQTDQHRAGHTEKGWQVSGPSPGAKGASFIQGIPAPKPIQENESRFSTTFSTGLGVEN